jgi:signal-transduction protein with cAMP-binding, CBS, and nucleotidyltransferase domain
LDEAIHHLIMGHHQSLLVKRDDQIVGILRLTDVFSAVFQPLIVSETTSFNANELKHRFQRCALIRR